MFDIVGLFFILYDFVDVFILIKDTIINWFFRGNNLNYNRNIYIKYYNYLLFY